MKKTRQQLREQRLASLVIMAITLAATWLTAQFGVIIVTAFFASISVYAGISAGYAQYKLQTFKF
jgi:hypothetical protein